MEVKELCYETEVQEAAISQKSMSIFRTSVGNLFETVLLDYEGWGGGG
jgi:hypothetical protein